MMEDHPRLCKGDGAVVAELVRETRPKAGPLDLSTHMELDLGLDSIARVELLTFVEGRLGCRIEENAAGGIVTLGDLLEVLAASRKAAAGRGRRWKQILSVDPDDERYNKSVFYPGRLERLAGYLFIKSLGWKAKLLFRLRCSGLEKLPRDEPFLICPNHESFLDGPLMIAVLPREVIDKIVILAYSTYWKNPIMQRIARFSRIIPIDPNVNLLRGMQMAAAGLRRNRVLLVFPEGSRCVDGRVDEFKKGAAILALETGVPVVPVGIHGTYEAWPRGGRLRFHPVELVIGDPIDSRNFAGLPDSYAALTEAMQTRVKQLVNDT